MNLTETRASKKTQAAIKKWAGKKKKVKRVKDEFSHLEGDHKGDHIATELKKKRDEKNISSSTEYDWQNRIYESLTEVSLKMAAQAAGKARHTRPQQVPTTGGSLNSPHDPELAAASAQRTDAQIKRVKGKLAQRVIKKHGEAGEKNVYTKPGEVPAELGGGRYERTLKGTVPQRTVYSGGRRETRAQSVDRKFEKTAKKAQKTSWKNDPKYQPKPKGTDSMGREG